jgi:hypothetical protein
MVQSAESLFIGDDTEDAPWMVMSDWQWAAVTLFYDLLRDLVSHHSPPLYVAGMLPIIYHPVPDDPRTQILAPDMFVARVDPHFRSSYQLEEEGVAPAFVLEVLSPESRRRDTVEKRRAYEAIGVEEYLLFDPRRGLLAPRLQGYRRDGARFVRWKPDGDRRLWSEVLEAWLTMIGDDLRLQRENGTLVPSPAEMGEENRRLAKELERLRARLGESAANER